MLGIVRVSQSTESKMAGRTKVLCYDPSNTSMGIPNQECDEAIDAEKLGAHMRISGPEGMNIT